MLMAPLRQYDISNNLNDFLIISGARIPWINYTCPCSFDVQIIATSHTTNLIKIKVDRVKIIIYFKQ